MSASPTSNSPAAAAFDGLNRLSPAHAWWPALGVALIVAIAALAYWPALKGRFILDDELLLGGNELIHAPDGLYWFWCSTKPPDYWPLTNSSFWLEWRLWGANPTGYHVTNLALHIAAVLLIWTVLRKLAIPGAFLAALLFAVHPVNTESVAWISQRKNVLAMVFFLLSVFWYLHSEEEKSGRGAEENRGVRLRHRVWHLLSLLAFILAMLSKGSVAVLPVVLLLIGWWQRRRIRQSDLVRTAPFFLVALALTAVNVWFQTHGTDTVVRHASFVQRLLGAGAVVWFYLSKALVPINLAFIYPQWQIEARTMSWWFPLAAALIVTLILARRRNWTPMNWGRATFFAWALFCVALLPVLGFTDVTYMHYSLVADHYQHLALLAVVALAAAAWSLWRRQSAIKSVAWIAAVGLVGALTFLTWQQNRLYGDVIGLYQETVERNPDCFIARNNLATALVNEGRLQEAITQCRQALEVKPDYPEPHCNMGVALARLGNLPEAIAEYHEALRLKPNYFNAHYNLANALAATGRAPEAIEQYGQALQLEPNDAATHFNFANALLATRQFEAAIGHYQTALTLNLDSPDAHDNLGVALLNAGRPQEAIEHFRQALTLQPDDTMAYFNLAMTYAQMKHPNEAVDSAQKALEMARGQGQTALVQQIEAWLANYHSQKANPPRARDPSTQ